MNDVADKDKAKQLPINQETLDVIVANVIPTSKYFEVRFDHLENRVDRIQDDLIEFRRDVDRRFDDFKSDVGQRFEQVGQRFEQVDKRFEQVDKRFEQVDKRFEQVIALIDRLGDRLDSRDKEHSASIDRLVDRLDNRDKEHRGFTMRMFSISIMISFFGVLGMFLKLFQIV